MVTQLEKIRQVEYGQFRRGKAFWFMSDFGDGTATGESLKTARNIFREQNTLYEPIIINDIAALSILHGAWVTHRQASGVKNGVFVTVVDPEVGSERLPVAIVTADNNVFVAPNNGVAYYAAQAHGIVEAYELIPEEEISFTFHGRDLFMPHGAKIACGADPADLGKPIPLDTLKPLSLQVNCLLHEDIFGNLKANDIVPQRANYLRLTKTEANRRGISLVLPVVNTFASVDYGKLCAYTGSSECLEIALRNGNAGKALRNFGINIEIGQPLQYEFGFDTRFTKVNGAVRRVGVKN